MFVITGCFCAEALWVLYSHLLKQPVTLQIMPFPVTTKLLKS